MAQQGLPKTLQQAIRYFANETTCINFVAELRWPEGAICPKCTSQDVHFMESRRVWICRGCRKQFSVKVGTIFEDSPISLDKWMCAIWMIVNCKNGISSYEVARDLGVTQKTAWFMMHRIRLALQNKSLSKLSGEVEVDETLICGKARNMHFGPKRKLAGQGGGGKALVLGMLERGGRVKAMVVRKRGTALQSPIVKQVAKGSHIFSDEHKGYSGLKEEYLHRVVNHAETYVDGQVHTNGIENFWSLLKRGIRGTYVSVEPFHLFRYLDEQVYRFNSRKGNDQDRFLAALSSVSGRRLIYQQLVGQTSL